jgi:hypothetical protein
MPNKNVMNNPEKSQTKIRRRDWGKRERGDL